MERADRIETLIDCDMDIDTALMIGVTPQDADDAASFLRVRLEVDGTEPREKLRPLVDAALRRMLRVD